MERLEPRRMLDNLDYDRSAIGRPKLTVAAFQRFPNVVDRVRPQRVGVEGRFKPRAAPIELIRHPFGLRHRWAPLLVMSARKAPMRQNEGAASASIWMATCRACIRRSIFCVFDATG